jgi:hypothetical protein
MPLRWDIDHAARFVHVVAEGPVTLKEMEGHFDALVLANAMGYAKLFDSSRGQPVYTDADVLTMGARLSAYTATLPSGPLAVVGTSDLVWSTFKRFVNISPSRRPAKLFVSVDKARAWLKEQQAD